MWSHGDIFNVVQQMAGALSTQAHTRLLAERHHFTSFKGHLDDSKACTRGAHEELKTTTT
jgi:hypothetical protein